MLQLKDLVQILKLLLIFKYNIINYISSDDVFQFSLTSALVAESCSLPVRLKLLGMRFKNGTLTGKYPGFLFFLSAPGAVVDVSLPGTWKIPGRALGFIRFAGLHPNEAKGPLLLLLVQNNDDGSKVKFRGRLLAKCPKAATTTRLTKIRIMLCSSC
jgi:hypothetical protein